MNYIELDEIDKKILNENFDNEILERLDSENVGKIYKYLIDNGVYYAKDLFISQADLFLISYNEFVNKFEDIKKSLGGNYIEMISEDSLLLDSMYE